MRDFTLSDLLDKPPSQVSSLLSPGMLLHFYRAWGSALSLFSLSCFSVLVDLYFEVYFYLLRSLPALKKGRDGARYIETSPCDEPDRQLLRIARTPLAWYTFFFLFFFLHTSTFQLLDKPWSQVSSLLPPGSYLQFLSRIGFSNPTARRFFIECR